ncbi:MAG: HU family DNA-binding protein [Aquificaceae bacterium]
MRKELIKRVSQKTGIGKKQARKLLSVFCECLEEELVKEGKVVLHHIGTIYLGKQRLRFRKSYSLKLSSSTRFSV